MGVNQMRGPTGLKLPLNHNRIKDSILKWVKNHKKAALLLGSLPVTVPLFYFADVWAIGSLAAVIHDLQVKLSAMTIFALQEQKMATETHATMLPYISKHPVATGMAWLTKPAEALSHPEVKQIWKWLNVFLGTALAIGYPVWRFRHRGDNSSTRVHGLKIVDNSAYGTSRWAGRGDIKQFCEFGPPVPREKNSHNGVKFPGGNLIGELEGKIIRVNFEKVPDNTPKTAPHMIVFGGTGSGKSFSIVIGNIISAVAEGQSIVVIDPKGELFKATGNWLKEQGYKNVWVLNFMQPEHSHRWNPLIECLDDAEISEMVDTLSINAVGPNPSYFQQKGMELMEALIGLLKGDFPIDQQHMRSIMTLSAWSEEKLDERFRAAYKAGKISPTVYERWRGVVKVNCEYAVSNLTAAIKNLTTAPLAALMSRQEIDLSAIGREKTALFLIIPTGGEGVYLKPILSIFYKFLFKRLDKLAFISPGQKLPVPVRNIWDEMANVGVIPGLPEIISTARSKGIHIQMILQTIKQLESVYGINNASTILGNCPTVMLIGVAPADEDLAQMFSSKLGAAAVEMERVSEDLTIPVKHLFEPKKKVRTVIERPLMTRDEILRLDPKDAIALLQWSYPLYLRKVGWTQLPQAKQIQKCGALPVEQTIPARGFEISLPEIEETNQVKTQDINTESALWRQLQGQSAAESPKTELPGESSLYGKSAQIEAEIMRKKTTEDNKPNLTNQSSYDISSYIRLGQNQVDEHLTLTNEYQEQCPEEPAEAAEPEAPVQNKATPPEEVAEQGFKVKSPLF